MVLISLAVRATESQTLSQHRILRHIVFYKFHSHLAAEQIQEVVDAFKLLPSRIDTVIDFEFGINVSAEGKSEGFTHAFMVSFRDERGRDHYLAHPAHQDYVRMVKERREKVIVADYWMDR